MTGNTTSKSYGFGYNASLLIFDGFGRNKNLKVAHANEDAAGASLVDARFQNQLNDYQRLLRCTGGDAGASGGASPR